MREIAAKMPFPQRVAVAEYLTGKRAGSSRPTDPSAGQCAGPASSVFPEPNGTVGAWTWTTADSNLPIRLGSLRLKCRN